MNNPIVYSTPWFNITAASIPGTDDPYYIVNGPDCVSVIAITNTEKILLVKQFRPTIQTLTWELPSGHIEDGETPEDAARREVLEETGYQVDNLELLRVFVAETGRLGFKSWCYIARNAFKIQEPCAPEVTEIITCTPDDLITMIKNKDINDALNVATIFLGLQFGKIMENKIE